MLGGFGATAIAVAPGSLVNEPVAQRVIEESLDLPGLSAQADALAGHTLLFSRSTTTRDADTADALLRRLGVGDAKAAQALRAEPVFSKLLLARAGRLVQAQANGQGELTELVARMPALDGAQADTHFTRLTLRRQGDGWHTELQAVPLQRSVRMGSGTIVSSLFAATDEARVPDDVAARLAEIFASEIDFHRDLQRGDRFAVLYEAQLADGEPAPWVKASGQVLAAEFVNRGQTLQAFWFASGPQGKGEYFGADGRSKRRAYLASPLEFSRVSSGFAMRIHPLLKSWRQHLGTDYAAPSGTPVRTVGNGVVEFAGLQNGYGNVVQIKHSADHSTLYAHLASIQVRPGQKVEQGQNIGTVGATGWATGPHLHFEFRVKGQHQDPQRMIQVSETLALDAAAKQRFGLQKVAALAQLQAAGALANGRQRFE